MSDDGGGKKGGAAGFQKGGQYWKYNNNNATGPEVFASMCAELKGLTLDCGQPHHAETYSKAIEGIINHGWVTFREGFLVARTIFTETLVPDPRPKVVLGDDGAASTDAVEVAIFNSRIKNYTWPRIWSGVGAMYS